MSRTTVNIQRINRLRDVGNEGLTLVILTNATYKSGKGTAGTVTKITSVEELYNTVEPHDNTDYLGMGQLVNAEYLLRNGVPILVYPTLTRKEFIKDDADYLIDEVYGEDYNFVQVLVPYNYVDIGSLAITVAKELSSKADVTAQIFLDIDPTVPVENVSTKAALISGNAVVAGAKVDVCLNTISPAFTINKEGNMAVPIFGTNGYYGVLGSTLVAARKAQLLMNGTPWLPVAGQENGAVRDGISLYKKYSKKQRNTIQEAKVNLLTNKVGFGPLFVSQNTMYTSDNLTDPLLRSHVVTEALWIKRELQKLGSRFEHSLSIVKTVNYIEAALRDFFNKIYAANGLEQPALIDVVLKDNSIKAYIEYIPVKAVEAIEINVSLIDDTVEVGIAQDGGNL